MIRWQLDGDLAFVTLDRPQARNAISLAGWQALATAIDEMALSSPRAVVIQSAAPDIFSAGADLGEFRALVADPALRSGFRVTMATAIERLASLPMPVIAAVDGGCFGAAVAVTLACDIVVAGDAAVFATTPAKLGLSYPASDVARLKARVGDGRAALMLFTGDRLNADEALGAGLAHARAPNAGLRAVELARTIAGNAPDAVRKLKQVVQAPLRAEHDTGFDDAFGSPEFADRLTAFLDGRR